MTLMLTVSPIIWAYAVFLCLQTFPKKNLFKGAIWNSLIFLAMAVLMDYLFFGVIRNAMEELYHPTTLYGYGFLVCLPFLMVLFFKKKLERKGKGIEYADFAKAGIIGSACIVILTIIIAFDVSI